MKDQRQKTGSEKADYYLILDSGTSATKVFVLSKNGAIVFNRKIKHLLRRPAPLHVESDAAATLAACRKLITWAAEYVDQQNGVLREAGISVQRSTFLFWDKQTKEPVTPALNWQDSRAGMIVSQLAPHAERISETTGIPLNAHFGGAKYAHLAGSDSKLAKRARDGSVWFGPLSSYLIQNLTGHLGIDETIAGRSQLMDLDHISWSAELAGYFGVNRANLPPIHHPVGKFGNIDCATKPVPLKCIIGDQQAALIGQAGMLPDSLAMNLGTSGSILRNTGPTPVHIPALLANVLISDSARRFFLLEGTINACNSLFYWLEQDLGIPHQEMDWNARCLNRETPGILIPGFIGLAAPYWTSGHPTIKYNLENAGANQIIRAGMESIGFLASDIINRMPGRRAYDAPLTVSGGGARPALLQFLADILERPIAHSAVKDRTALGVYHLLRNLCDGKDMPGSAVCDQVFYPARTASWRESKLEDWSMALLQAGIKPV